MSVHISKLCVAAFHQIHNICYIRRFLSLDATKALVRVLVATYVDYCNSLLYGYPAFQLNNSLLKMGRQPAQRAASFGNLTVSTVILNEVFTTVPEQLIGLFL